MSKPFRVLQIGFGTIGKGIAQAIIERANLDLVGVVDVNPELQNKDVEKLLSLEPNKPTTIRGDLTQVLKELQERPADVALVLTSSALDKVSPTISQCLKAGMDVLSLCEELSYPYFRHPKLSKELDQLGKQVGKTILGTGINPGFLMDLLPIVLSAPCISVTNVHVIRHMNSSHRRQAFQKKIGTGMTKKDFIDAINRKVITGHVGLIESIHMFGEALNFELDHVEELPPEPVIASQEIKTPFFSVKKGEVRGLKSRAIGQKNGQTMVTLDFHAYADASPEYDEVRIEGKPMIHQRIEGGVQGDLGTIGMSVNMIPLVIQAQPGLLTMKDLPVPHNTQRVWKR
jgi:4-hydroxy-tetrahydrodipicolinate reductase